MDEEESDAISVTAHPVPGGMRFAITGAMDIANAAPVARLLRDASRDLDAVVIDLTAVTYLDSQGVAELHRLHRHFMDQGRVLEVAVGRDTIAGKILRLTQLDTVWNLADRHGPHVVEPRRSPE